ncbi:MAG: hypothetical protein JOZ01_03195 [Candidatus Eremiobacteraeota bacterium]|nr:hypothetical protein [Candidatus Eremiobacteraeota bacterium]
MNACWLRNLVLVLALAAGTVPAGARPSATPTPAPTATPVADPVVTKIARQQFVAWQAGSINKSLYAPQVVPKLTDAKVNDVAHALSGLGPLVDTAFIGPFSAADIPPDARGYIYQMRCTDGNVYLWMIIDGSGKIATIFFRNTLDVDTIERPGTPAPASPRP